MPRARKIQWGAAGWAQPEKAKRKRVWQTAAVRAAPPAEVVELALATIAAPPGQRVICDYPPNALSLNARPPRHIRTKAKAKYRSDCRVLALAAKMSAPADGDIIIRLDVFPPDRARRDDDDPIGRFKSGRDGIADAMKVDDHRFRVTPVVHRQPPLGCIVFTIIKGAGE
jgi:hypothetical protein